MNNSNIFNNENINNILLIISIIIIVIFISISIYILTSMNKLVIPNTKEKYKKVTFNPKINIKYI